MTARFRSLYGASPLHLVAHLAALALIAFAVVQLAGVRAAGNVLVWFVAAVILHDMVLLPAYSVIDRALQGALPRAALNHVRVPAGLSLLLLLVFWGPISGRSDGVARSVSGIAPSGFLGRWAIATAILFGLSALLFVVRRRRRGSAGG